MKQVAIYDSIYIGGPQHIVFKRTLINITLLLFNDNI